MSQNENKNERQNILQRLTIAGAALAQNAVERVALTWAAAEIAVELRETFGNSSEERKAFRATAATAAKVSESQIDLWTAAVDTRETLTTKQAENTATWNVDSVRLMSNMSQGERTSLIGSAKKEGTQNVKVLREIKNKMNGKTPNKRNTKDSAAKTAKLAERMQDDVQKLLDNGHEPTSLAAGAELARKYQGDVGSAIIFVAAQVRAAAEIAA